MSGREESPIFKLGSFVSFTLFAAAVLPGAGDSHPEDPRAGSWTLVSAQSTLTPPNQLTVSAVGNGVHVTMSGENRLDFTANANGHAAPVAGNPAFNLVELHRVNKLQAVCTEKKDGAVVATVRESISKDGNMLTVTTSASGHPDQISIWTRTGGAKVAREPLAGDWTQDMSQTRLRQGWTVRIEPDGNGGARFTGGYSYSARFDGKPYDVQNSRNDTVALQLADPRTVDEVYRRDNQVTEKDQWTVSSDGRQMTATIAGTLETGQRVTEKLVFKKQ